MVEYYYFQGSPIEEYYYLLGSPIKEYYYLQGSPIEEYYYLQGSPIEEILYISQHQGCCVLRTHIVLEVTIDRIDEIRFQFNFIVTVHGTNAEPMKCS